MKLYKHYSQVPGDAWPWKNFSPKEIASKGEGEVVVNERALDALQRLRDDLGKPLIINSAYRSKEHNKRVGGSSTSVHLSGGAFDVSMQNHDPHLFEQAARRAGFHRFGFYPKKNFIHIDIEAGRGKPEWGDRWEQKEHSFEQNKDNRKTANSATATAGGVAGAGTVGLALTGGEDEVDAATTPDATTPPETPDPQQQEQAPDPSSDAALTPDPTPETDLDKTPAPQVSDHTPPDDQVDGLFGLSALEPWHWQLLLVLLIIACVAFIYFTRKDDR
ncbi:MAG: D-Ala-D-Ala carboxypeptidase family metallohydrolase [Pseudomonadota bacterium]